MPRNVLLLSSARVGSHFLMENVKSHPKVRFCGEILNMPSGTFNGRESVVKFINEKLLEKCTADIPYVGFKVTPHQLQAHGIRLDELAHSLDVHLIIILWRKNALATYTSLRMAMETDQWYLEKGDKNKADSVVLDVKEEEFMEYVTEEERHWQRVAKEYPISIPPIFISYEKLTADPRGEVAEIWTQLSLHAVETKSVMQKQNPRPLQERISNWNQLSQRAKVSSVKVPSIINEAILSKIPKPAHDIIPERNPPPPASGWKYRVANAFTPSESKRNVHTAVETGNVSSGTHWVSKMSEILKHLHQCPVAQPCSNGYSALVLALMCIKLKPGDEVIIPSLTMVAVANAVKHVGASPTFADCMENGYNPGCKEIEAVASTRTRAVVTCHLYGTPAPILQIKKLCKARNWVLIEDISECVGVRIQDESKKLRHLGSFGDFGCASLYANKIVGAGDGGYVVAKDPVFGPVLRSLVNHAFTPSFHFLHFRESLNAKINGMGAAFACGTLGKIHEVMEHRSNLSSWYREHLKSSGLTLMPECGFGDTPWVFAVQSGTHQTRVQLRSHLAKWGIETRNFFFPLHLQPTFYNESFQGCPRAMRLSCTGFYLPTFYGLSKVAVGDICLKIRDFFKGQQHVSSDMKLDPKRSFSIFFDTESFLLECREYEDNRMVSVECSNSAVLQATWLLNNLLPNYYLKETWSNRNSIKTEISHVLRKLKGPQFEALRKKLDIHLRYIELSDPRDEHTCYAPWIAEPWKIGDIPTTTEPETVELLRWIIQSNEGVKTIVEIGSWLGGTTSAMAEVLCQRESKSRGKIFAVDCFKWQKWMNAYVPPRDTLKTTEDFEKHFTKNLGCYGDLVCTVPWEYGSSLDSKLLPSSIDLVFLDFSTNESEIQNAWDTMRPKMVPGKTIIVINSIGLASHSGVLEWITKHREEISEVYKPHSHAKAFIFSPKGDLKEAIGNAEMNRWLKFSNPAKWTHHHLSSYDSIMTTLQSEYDCNEAKVMFIPAVGQFLCDHEEILSPWIGVIHSVVDNPQQPHVPHLKQLCFTPKYRKTLERCVGLITLTSFQKTFLMKNLPVKIPISRLFYPYHPSLKTIHGTPVHERKKLVLVGAFCRDFAYFLRTRVPAHFKKIILNSSAFQDFAQVLEHKRLSHRIKEVQVLDRLSGDEYEKLLGSSIVFLSLTHDGAANTIVIECIATNTPIVAPKLEACMEYLGSGYPLFYDPNNDDLQCLLSKENIVKARQYLETMDKTKFSVSHFQSAFRKTAVFKSVPYTSKRQSNEDRSPLDHTFDVTVSLMSYKRTDNLPRILKSIFEEQDYDGTFEVILWNNNYSRRAIVDSLCERFLRLHPTRLKVIHSTENLYCTIRLSLAPIMRSGELIICDDDCFPKAHFISSFMKERNTYPNAFLCLRGHRFSEHELNMENPSEVWSEYKHIKFIGDDEPSCLIHFVHADTCAIPRQALRHAASVPCPSQTFNLVDDYWMSYVLSSKFGTPLRKVCIRPIPIERAPDSDAKGIALYTRPEVKAAKEELYVHHMCRGWPFGNGTNPKNCSLTAPFTRQKASQAKVAENDLQPLRGFNVSSSLDTKSMQELASYGIKVVRIGAVETGKDEKKIDLDYLKPTNDKVPTEGLNRLIDVVKKWKSLGVSTILTMDTRVASTKVWGAVVKALKRASTSLLAYDLINEPWTDIEERIHWVDIPEKDVGRVRLYEQYSQMISVIRDHDKEAKIIIEPTYWGNHYALRYIPTRFLGDPNIIISFHFYEPRPLTVRRYNKGKLGFPGDIPLYPNSHYNAKFWDEAVVEHTLNEVWEWAEKSNVPRSRLLVGEAGIWYGARGASRYLKCLIESCIKSNVGILLYAFRESGFDAYNYELGECGESGRIFHVVLNSLRTKASDNNSQPLKLSSNSHSEGTVQVFKPQHEWPMKLSASSHSKGSVQDSKLQYGSVQDSQDAKLQHEVPSFTRKALIVGITGQDGTYLAEFLLAKGYQVHGIVRRMSAKREKWVGEHWMQRGKSLILHIGDLTDMTSLVSILAEVRPNEVYNLAAQSHVQDSFYRPQSALLTNTIGVVNLLEAIRANDLSETVRVYQASTSEMYGDVVTSPQDERTPFNPASPYGISKLASHLMCGVYREAYKMYICCGILFNHESPRRGEDFVTRKITCGVAAIKLGQQTCLKIGNLDAERDWGFAPEYVDGMWRMMQQKHPQDFVLATNKSATVREFVTLAFEVVGIALHFEGKGLDERGYYLTSNNTKKFVVKVDPSFFRAKEVNALKGNAQLAHAQLNWTSKTSLRSLCEKMVKADLQRLNLRSMQG